MALAKLGVCDMKKSEITEQIGCLRFISELILAPNDCSYNIVVPGIYHLQIDVLVSEGVSRRSV